MASNSFGTIFRMTTWGESHGKAIGVVIDGCPSQVEISENEIQEALARRRPGASIYTSPRKEEDRCEILSGVFEGKTTGAPISILIPNKDVDSSSYEEKKNLLRPGHAHFTYLQKYGVFDYRGGGRASGRETACRVAAGAIAKKVLEMAGIEVVAFLLQVEKHRVSSVKTQDIKNLQKDVYQSSIFCPEKSTEKKIMQSLIDVQKEGDSLGGSVGFIATGPLLGLGDPVYEKLSANLAKAMMSIPAAKAFEIGEGFSACAMKGSEHNDLYVKKSGETTLESNHSGGILGGIANGMPIYGRVGFKPTSSIKKPQKTVSINQEEAVYATSDKERHDPCLAIRAVPVVEAMLSLVLVDALLLQRCARI